MTRDPAALRQLLQRLPAAMPQSRLQLVAAWVKAGAYRDDCQIDELEICRQDPHGAGSVEVSIRELPGDATLFDEPPTPEE
jgi:hypothetical protein